MLKEKNLEDRMDGMMKLQTVRGVYREELVGRELK